MRGIACALVALCATAGVRPVYAELMFSDVEGAQISMGAIDGLDAPAVDETFLDGPDFAFGQVDQSVFDVFDLVGQSTVTGVASILGNDTATPSIVVEYAASAFILPGYSGFMESALFLDLFFTIEEETAFSEQITGAGNYLLAADASGGDPGEIVGNILMPGDYRIDTSLGILVDSLGLESSDGVYVLQLPTPGAGFLLVVSVLVGFRRRRT